MLIDLLSGLIFLGIAIIVWKQFHPSADTSLLKDALDRLQKDVQESRIKDREHLQERLDHIGKLMSDSNQHSLKTLQTQYQQSVTSIQKITEELTRLQESNKQIVQYSAKLEDLQNILQNPKGKGLISEYWLEAMLGHVLQPGQYQMQYKFENGEIVDAVLFFQEKIIPIDAKFSSEKYSVIAREKDGKKREPLEKAFRQDLKLRIDETSKYIRPSEGTTEFAFMFLPAEGIYYDLLIQKVGTLEINRENLIEYAFSKHVVIVSPVTFFAYLQTVLQGLKAWKMQESVQEIIKQVEKLGHHMDSYETFMQKLGSNLGTTVNMYNQAYREFQKVDKDIYKLTDGTQGGNMTGLELDRPAEHTESKSRLFAGVK